MGTGSFVEPAAGAYTRSGSWQGAALAWESQRYGGVTSLQSHHPLAMRNLLSLKLCHYQTWMPERYHDIPDSFSGTLLASGQSQNLGAVQL
jgi:hypothetical protein